jgi:cytochrome o ubiquinol oxidase subunit 2
MAKKQKLVFFTVLLGVLAVIAAIVFFIIMPSFGPFNFVIFNPKGVIASQESRLLITVTLIMLTLVIPVFITLFLFIFKYRAGKNTAADSQTNHNPKFVIVLWALPALIILIISFINWKSTHRLDPYKAIASNAKPITIQVVALRWKWLFIYPEQKIATVNFIEFPAGTPVHFELTADDAPMNSFWIPQLGGQMYSMAGMETQLQLMASKPGEFTGSAAEISGAGFSGMKFLAKATSQADFDQWVETTKQAPSALTASAYNELLKPSSNNPPASYSFVDANLYNNIMMKYMAPATSSSMDMSEMGGMK